ncbi:hypothetical protein BE24_05400 [Staphylococcus xylosus]|uniref:hypothetical protein n=1 Tax=Staphylococcus xylosus TaxID=1288 RepID=UPI00049AD075|nr:hypothetical protein [Staphylococcus xylosus]AID03001.1 hypothetical protein BE24_05400 [Staphylococcus xylosus]
MSDEEGKEVIIEYNKIKVERDTLIDDLSWYKAKVSRLERENGQLKKEEKVNRTKASLLTEIKILKEKNERLRKVNSNGWKQKDKVINNLHYLYTTLTNHIRLKAEMNPSVSRYIDLVNYIDRLEQK